MISRIIQVAILVIVVLFAINVNAAVKIVECEDEQGNRFFQKTCSPGSTQINEKKLSTGVENDVDDVNINATLYSIPECESCDEVREFLSSRHVAITEKNVNDNLQLQNELSNITGVLKVPVTIIGDSVISGYNRSQLKEALVAAGYTED